MTRGQHPDLDMDSKLANCGHRVGRGVSVDGGVQTCLYSLLYLLPPHTPSLPLHYTFILAFGLSRKMPVQDRTNEFRACVESIRNRSSLPSRGAEQKQRLLQTQGRAEGSKSEFTRMANAIGKDISSTNLKLNKLGQRELLLLFTLLFQLILYSRQTQDVI